MNKKSNIMFITIIKVVLLLFCLFFLFSGGCKLYASLTYNPQEDMLKDQLDMFAAQINALTYSNQEYTAMPMFLSLEKGDLLIAFDSSDYSKYISASREFGVNKPSDCGSNSCLCLYKEWAVNSEPFYCVNVNADYIVASPIYKFLYELKSDFFGDAYLENKLDKFYGAQYPNGIKILNNLFLDIADNKAKIITYNLGFSDKYYYLILEMDADDLAIYADTSFFVELFQKEGIRILLLHPYSKDLNNRKYYFIKRKGINYCNNKFLHQAVLRNNEEYIYCKQDSFGLVESEEFFKECPKGQINELCVCGHRLVSSGFCGIQPGYPEIGILINPFQEIFCSNEMQNYDYCHDDKYSIYCENKLCD